MRTSTKAILYKTALSALQCSRYTSIVCCVQGEVDAYKRPSDLHGLPKDIELYQFEVCPYCCKVKAALDYYKVRQCYLLKAETNHRY